MKKMLSVLVITLLVTAARAQFTSANLQATGLTCAMCNNAIYKALQTLPFIASIKSDIKNSAFAIQFKDGAEVNINAIKKAVEDAGFSIGSLKLTGKFNDVKVENDKHVTVGNNVFHFLNVSNQTLNGEQTITIVDKDFVTAKQFKKISAATKMSCLQTGKAASCCEKEGIPADTRVYHATI